VCKLLYACGQCLVINYLESWRCVLIKIITCLLKIKRKNYAHNTPRTRTHSTQCTPRTRTTHTTHTHSTQHTPHTRTHSTQHTTHTHTQHPHDARTRTTHVHTRMHTHHAHRGVARIATLEGQSVIRGANNQFLSQNRLIFLIFTDFFDFINSRLVFIGALGGPGPCPPPFASAPARTHSTCMQPHTTHTHAQHIMYTHACKHKKMRAKEGNVNTKIW
jgi:hypothetical protein